MDGGLDVLLFGEALIDELPRGRVPGGAPLNVACHLRALGASPFLVTRIGRDEDGRHLLGLLRRRGLDERGVQRDAERPTGRVAVRETGEGPSFEIPARQAFDFVDPDAALTATKGLSPRVVYFGTLAQRQAPSRTALEALLKARPGTRFFDVNLRAPWFDRDVVVTSLRLADVAKMNEMESAEIASLLEMAPSGRGFRGALATRFGLSEVVVTRGAEGAVYRSGDGSEISIPPPRRAPRIVDTVGAGDAFSATMILGFLRGWAPEVTVRRADAFARAVCRLRGALPRRLSFYGKFLEAWEDGKSP
jgi:fructokinase